MLYQNIFENNFIPIYNTHIPDEELKYYEIEKLFKNGITLNFSGLDTKELFEKNLRFKPKNWYYRNHDIKYTLNSLGYRTKEFDEIDWKESIVIFGCSVIFGVGVTDEHTIPYFLEKMSGRPVINLGVGGSSVQTTLYNSIILNDSKYPTPKAVVSSWTELSRYQYYDYNSGFVFVGDWNRDDKDIIKIPKISAIEASLMNIKMFRNLWKNKTIYYEYSSFFEKQSNLIRKLDNNFFSDNMIIKIDNNFDKARDLVHSGPKTNKMIAEKIYEKLKSQLDS